MTTPNNHYGESAYNSRNIPPQRQLKATGFLKMLASQGSRLGLNRLNNHRVVSAIEHFTPSLWPLVVEEIKRNEQPWWNHQRIAHDKANGWTQVYLFACGLGEVLCLFFFLWHYLLSYTTL